jgi:hypothetical protein
MNRTKRGDRLTWDQHEINMNEEMEILNRLGSQADGQAFANLAQGRNAEIEAMHDESADLSGSVRSPKVADPTNAVHRLFQN